MGYFLINIWATLCMSVFQRQPSRGILKKNRSSHPEVFLRRGVLKICSKFKGEYPCWYSPVNLLHIFRAPFPKNTFEGMILMFDIHYRSNKFRSLSVLSAIVFRYGVLVVLLLLIQLFQLFDPMWEVVNNWYIIGNKSISHQEIKSI